MHHPRSVRERGLGRQSRSRTARGREYADPVKAEPQRKAREAETERERTAQGGWLGFGRKVYEGDKDYNRGTLNPAKR